MACDINGESRIRIDLPFTRTAFHSRVLTRLKQVYEKASWGGSDTSEQLDSVHFRMYIRV